MQRHCVWLAAAAGRQLWYTPTYVWHGLKKAFEFGAPFNGLAGCNYGEFFQHFNDEVMEYWTAADILTPTIYIPPNSE